MFDSGNAYYYADSMRQVANKFRDLPLLELMAIVPYEYDGSDAHAYKESVISLRSELLELTALIDETSNCIKRAVDDIIREEKAKLDEQLGKLTEGGGG